MQSGGGPHLCGDAAGFAAAGVLPRRGAHPQPRRKTSRCFSTSQKHWFEVSAAIPGSSPVPASLAVSRRPRTRIPFDEAIASADAAKAFTRRHRPRRGSDAWVLEPAVDRCVQDDCGAGGRRAPESGHGLVARMLRRARIAAATGQACQRPPSSYRNLTFHGAGDPPAIQLTSHPTRKLTSRSIVTLARHGC